MTQDNSKDLLKSVLAKRRDCIELNAEEQKFVDETYGKLFEKKFGGRTFLVKTGTEIRKNIGKPADVQPEDAIADERSKFGTKDSEIENDDPSGTVKAIEEDDLVNVDEKDGDKSAEQTNASDIINADNKDEQRKPTLKFAFGDPVVQIVGKRAIAGVVVQAYTAKRAVMVKWVNGTFSTVSYDSLEKIADKYAEEKEHTPPVTADSSHEVKTPGTDKADVKKDATIAEEDETPKDEASETPEEQAQEGAEGTEQHDTPTDEEVNDNAWYAKCEKAVGENTNVTDSKSICMFVRTTMKKSSEKIIQISKEEIAKSNPKLAEQMEKDGHPFMKFDTEAFEKAE